MLDGSEFSFEYEDEISLTSSLPEDDGDCSDDGAGNSWPTGNSETEYSPCSSQINSAAVPVENLSIADGKERAIKLSNSLSGVFYRPLSVAFYVNEHMVQPGERLRRDFLPNFTLDDAVLLLHHKKWLVDEVTSDFFGDWPKLRDACGLTDVRDTKHEIRLVGPFFCPICCDSGDLRVFSLLCGHEYCTSCYKKYVSLNLAKGAIIRCMDTQCHLALSYEDVAALLSEATEEETGENLGENEQNPVCLSSSTTKKEENGQSDESTGESDESDIDEYDLQFENMEFQQSPVLLIENDRLLLRNPLLINAARVSIDALRSQYRWCPAVDCSQLVEYVSGVSPESAAQSPEDDAKRSSDLSRIAIVSCGNHHEFCFDCHYENHLPCPCWLAKAWIKRCEDDSETANWIDANTQGCPKCQSVIEKNGGCNHMVCGKCGNEFCWICLGDWAMHKLSYWQCNRFDPKEVEEVKKKRLDKQNSLSRYLHFYRRFSVHQVSMNGDKDTLRMVHRCMLQYMKAQTFSSERTGSWNDVQFLSDAIRSLSRGRKTLMWTYAFAFYLNKSNYSEIFEGMQDYLNKTVEDLSRLFEEIKVKDSPTKTAAKITLKRAEIMGLASLVARRRDLLIECAQTGIQQGTLLFFTP